MTLDLSQSVTDSRVGAEELVVLSSVPLLKTRQLGGDGLEEANDDTDRRGLHVIAELVDGLLIRDTVVAVELHLLPDGEKNGSQHEDRGPVLELVTGVDRAVQGRQLLEDVLLQLTPHVRKSALDLEVDHDRCDSLAAELAGRVVDAANKLLLVGKTLHKSDVDGEVVGEDKLERLADRRGLLLLVVAVGSLEDLSDESSALKVVINKVLKALVKVAIEVLGQQGGADALHASRKLSGGELVLVESLSLDPVNIEALVFPDEHLAGVDGQVVAVTVSDVESTLHGAEALDVVDTESKADVPLIVGLPVLHEVANVLDVKTGARDLPQAGVAGPATATRLTLVASLLKELAAQTGTEFADLVCLLPLVGSERAASATNLLLAGSVFPAGGRLLDNSLGDFGHGSAFGRRLTAAKRWRSRARRCRRS